MTRPTLRVRLGLLLLRVAGWLAVRGLRLAGASSLTVETPEYTAKREAASERLRAALDRYAEARRTCQCADCVQGRAAQQARWN